MIELEMSIRGDWGLLGRIPVICKRKLKIEAKMEVQVFAINEDTRDRDSSAEYR